MSEYDNVSVLVTGAASGIGLAAAARFARAGARLTMLDRAATVTAAARSVAPDARAIVADVADRASLSSALAATEPPEVLVNCAGTDRPGRFLESDPADWEWVIAVDLVGTMNCCHLLLPRMIEAHTSTSIVNVASDAGRVGSSRQAAYSAAKGGVIAFSKTLARESARDGVSVNAVCPGPTRTELVDRLSADDSRLADSLVRSVPMRRMGTVDEVAAAITFLGSPSARYMTGQTLSVSGGLTMV